MCLILEQCRYLREHNNVDTPIKKGEALSLFEAVGHEIREQNKKIRTHLAFIQTILCVGLPMGFTILGFLIK